MPAPSDAECDGSQPSNSNLSSDVHQEQSDLTPWQRIKRTLDFATTRIEPGEPVGLARLMQIEELRCYKYYLPSIVKKYCSLDINLLTAGT